MKDSEKIKPKKLECPIRMQELHPNAITAIRKFITLAQDSVKNKQAFIFLECEMLIGFKSSNPTERRLWLTNFDGVLDGMLLATDLTLDEVKLASEYVWQRYELKGLKVDHSKREPLYQYEFVKRSRPKFKEEKQVKSTRKNVPLTQSGITK